MKNESKIAHKSYNVLSLFKQNTSPYNHTFISSGSKSVIKPDDIKTFFIDFSIDAMTQVIE